MTWDTEVFGSSGSALAWDKDVFRESPAAPAEEGPVGPPDNRSSIAKMFNVSPAAYERNMAMLAAQRASGWGTGVQPLADRLGTGAAEAIGMPSMGPALGTTFGLIPDAIQMALGGEIAKGAAPAFDWGGKFLMSSALKPGAVAARKGKAEPAVQTLLDEGVNVTSGGLEKMKGLIGDLADEVRQKIANSGAMIDLHRVADYASDAYKKFRAGPLANQAIEDIGAAQGKLFSIPEVAGAREVPVQLAQDLKGGYQRAIGDKGYGELKLPTTEAEKGIARGFRTEIGQAVPSVLDPLARESNLINALKLAEFRVAQDAGKNPLGLGTLISEFYKIPYWMWDRSPLGKSLAARFLYSGQETLPALAGQGITGGILASQNQQ